MLSKHYWELKLDCALNERPRHLKICTYLLMRLTAAALSLESQNLQKFLKIQNYQTCYNKLKWALKIDFLAIFFVCSATFNQSVISSTPLLRIPKRHICKFSLNIFRIWMVCWSPS